MAGEPPSPSGSVCSFACYELKEKENVGSKWKFQLYQLVWIELMASVRKGTRDSISSLASRQAGEMEGLLNSTLQEQLQDRRRTRDALGQAENHSSGS